MCPDRQILSVYLDGELPSPWKEKMEAHLQNCPGCHSLLEGYTQVSGAIRNSTVHPEEAVRARMETAKQQVWQVLPWQNLPLQNLPPTGDTQKTPFPARVSVWRRSLAVPMPIAAAAAAILAIACFAALSRRAETPIKPPDAVVAMDMEAQGIMPISDMSGVLQYLSRDDLADFLIIRLPESKSFTSVGEPTMIKAADYSRRIPSP